MNGVVEKINNERISLLWTYPKTTQNLRWNYTTTKCLNIWEEQRNAKLHFKEHGELFAPPEARRKDTWAPPKNLDEHLKNEFNTDGQPWRTPVTQGWRDKIEGWKNKIKALRWFRWRFRRNDRGNWTPKKKRRRHLKLGFIPQEQTLKKGIDCLDEIRIRFIVCLSFIKLNWWQAKDFAYYLFFLKRIEKWHIANLRRSSWTTGRIWKNEWLKW